MSDAPPPPTSAPAPSATARGIVGTYLAISGLYTLATSLIWGINTLFLVSCGFSLTQVFLANAIFTGAMALFEIPTGALADTKGRRASFLLSLITLALGTVGFVAAAKTGSLGFVCAASLVIGLGYTFYSGAVEAWLVDALQSVSDPTPLDRVLAKGSLVASLAMLVGTVSGGLIGTANLALPYWVRAGLLVLLFLIAAVNMRDIGFSRPVSATRRSMVAEIARVAEVSLRLGWREPEVKTLVLLGAAPAIVQAWAFHAWQPHFLALLATDAVWITGVVAALVSLATMAGNALIGQLTRVCTRRSTLMGWSALAFALGTAGVGLTGSFWVALPLYLVAAVASGVQGPVRQAYLHKITASENRATVTSFASLVGSGASMGGQAGLGFLAGEGGLARGYLAGGLASAIALPLVAGLRRLRGPHDRIVGSAAGKSTCPMGLPDVAGIDAHVIESR